MRRFGHKHSGKGCAICTLDQSGLRVTKQRQILYETLCEINQPLNAEKIHGLMKEKAVDINLSTVYRVLEQFEQKGLVSKSLLQDNGKAVYGIASHEHSHHLLCTVCQQILTVGGCPLEGYGDYLAKRYNYQITGHKLEMYGVCPTCLEKERHDD